MILLAALNDWWDALSAPHQVFWFIAVVFSVLFFIQFVLLLIGLDSDGEMDASGDVDDFSHEFSALSVRSIIAFFTFFGWTGVLALNNGLPVWLAVLAAVLIGLGAMFIVAYLVYRFSQLEQSGNVDLRHALDRPGEVYLTIPGGGNGRGKVHLIVDGSLRELEAVTDGERLPTGAPVRVTEVLEGNVLKVESAPSIHDTASSLHA